jgi:TonB family protein
MQFPSLFPPSVWRLSLTLSSLLAVVNATWLMAEDVKAVVLVSADAKASQYEYLSLQKIKLNGKNEVRLVESVVVQTTRFSEKRYKKLRKVRLEALTKLAVLHGVPYAYLTETRRLPCLPDNFKFVSSEVAVSDMTNVMFEGNAIEQKIKRMVPLSEIEKIYFVAESTAIDEIAFRHATEESSIEIWQLFLRQFPGSVRTETARAELHSQFLDAAQQEFDRFQSGSFGSLAAAGNHLEQAELIRPGAPENQEFRQRLDEAKASFQAGLSNGQSLVEQADFDGACEALRPLERYAKDVPALKSLLDRALTESNRRHQETAEALLGSGRLEEAEREYLVALERLPNSGETKAKLDDVRIRIGIFEVSQLMEKSAYENALGRIADLSRTYPFDTRLQELTTRVKTARSEQLHSQAKPLYASAIVSGKGLDKKHLHALKLLEESHGLNPDEGVASDIRLVRRRLSDYYIDQAKQARGKPGGAGIGCSYLFLARAKFYDPSRTDVDELLDRARAEFVKKATFAVTVLVRDRSRTPDSANFALQLEAAITDVLVNSKLPGIWVVERDTLERIQSEEEMLRKLTGSSTQMNLQRAGAMIVVDVIANSVRSTDQTIQRQSRYVANEYLNREWQQHDANARYYDSLYDQCRKQLGKEHYSCQEYRNKREYFERLRGNVPQIIQDIQPYSFFERHRFVEASVKVSYRFVDTLTTVRMAQENLDEGNRIQGTEVSGAMPRDLQGIENRQLNIPNEIDYLAQFQQKAQGKLVVKTVSYFRNLHRKYYELAEAARLRNDLSAALEYDALFLFATPDKECPEAAKAKIFLRESFNLAFDENLAGMPFRPDSGTYTSPSVPSMPVSINEGGEVNSASTPDLVPPALVSRGEPESRLENRTVYPDGTPGLTSPAILQQTVPSYTDAAIKAKIEGVVLLQVVIRQDGAVSQPVVLRGLGYGLEENAIREVQTRWRFRPGRLGGKPVDCLATIEMTFQLR